MSNHCHIHILTLFPDLVDSYLKDALLSKAIKQGLIKISTCNLRQFSLNSYKSVDDKNYGGSDGVVIQAEVLLRALKSIKVKPDVQYHVVYLSPQGASWTSRKAQEYAKRFFNQDLPIENKNQAGQTDRTDRTDQTDQTDITEDISSNLKSDFKREELVLVCGRYAGIDQRFIRAFVHEEISIGDYILSGGELASLVLIESISRFIPGVLGRIESAVCDSFEENLLEAPQFTKPQLWNGYQVPEVLLSGHHSEIESWKKKISLLYTLKKRPDLFFENFDVSERNLCEKQQVQIASSCYEKKKINFSELLYFWKNLNSEDKDMMGLTELEMDPIWKKIHEDFNEA